MNEGSEKPVAFWQNGTRGAPNSIRGLPRPAYPPGYKEIVIANPVYSPGVAISVVAKLRLLLRTSTSSSQ